MRAIFKKATHFRNAAGDWSFYESRSSAAVIILSNIRRDLEPLRTRISLSKVQLAIPTPHTYRRVH
ncbi:MAG: hypothetical protein CMO80_06410 [Verrucomicrobiales bacterium]|nr:hypothetical protein [Verrucomicrobiales bacterium]